MTTHAVADVPTAVGHWRAAVAPASTLTTVRATVRSTAVGPGAGARSAVVSAGSAMGMRPLQTNLSLIVCLGPCFVFIQSPSHLNVKDLKAIEILIIVQYKLNIY